MKTQILTFKVLKTLLMMGGVLVLSCSKATKFEQRSPGTGPNPNPETSNLTQRELCEKGAANGDYTDCEEAAATFEKVATPNSAIDGSVAEELESTEPIVDVAIAHDSVPEVAVSSLAKFKPALAVRGTACLMCHAKVSSNIITDFGYGDKWFFGLDPKTSKTVIEKKVANKLLISPNRFFYGDYNLSYVKDANGIFKFGTEKEPISWRSATIKSVDDKEIEIIVPKGASLDKNGDYLKNFSDVEGYVNEVVNKKANPQNGPVVVKPANKVYIGAPTAFEIKDLGNFDKDGIFFKPDTSKDELGQIENKVVSGKSVFTIKDGFVCNGDVVFNGIVAFKGAENSRLKIKTRNGCRIYAVDSVFVEVGLDSVSDLPDSFPNIQISSATSIVMGVGMCGSSDQSIFKKRIVDDGGKVAYTRADPTSTVLPGKISAEFQLVKTRDARCKGKPVATVGFERILLNAPIIHSRFIGPVKGSVIAEIFVASLDKFNFTYDSVFENVPVLPLLKASSYLDIE